MIRLVRSAMCDLMPETERLPGLDAAELDGFLRRLRRDATPLYWMGIVLGALVYAISPLVTIGVPLPSFLLPAGLRNRHAERIVESRTYLVRQAIFILKLSAGMAWGMQSNVRDRFELPPLTGDPGTWRTS